MKFLCLHGYGTSGAIFKRQCAAFSRMLGSEHEYVFANGQYECGPHPDLIPFKEMFPGPYYNWFPTYSPRDIHRTLSYIKAIIQEQGPFDALMGFSQGGNLVMSYLLQHAIENPEKPAPVKFAVIISSGFACSGLSSTGAEYDAAFAQLAKSKGQSLKLDGRTMRVPDHRVVEDVAAAFRMWDEQTFRKKFPYESKEVELHPRPFHPLLLEERVGIPTVHIQGAMDKVRPQGEVLVGLCEEEGRRRVVHSGGHHMPKLVKEVNECVDAVRWAMERARRVEEVEAQDDWGYVTGELCIM